MDEASTIEKALGLLKRLEQDELSVGDVFDRVEVVTDDPYLQNRILQEAQNQGIIDRDGGTIYPKGTVRVDFEADVVSKEGEFDCERCSKSISEGYFIDAEAGEYGPYGSTCIRKVTGRE